MILCLSYCGCLWLEEKVGQAASGPDYFQQRFHSSRTHESFWFIYPCVEGLGRKTALWEEIGMWDSHRTLDQVEKRGDHCCDKSVL